MSQLLVTNNLNVSEFEYGVPNDLAYTAVRLKTALISNTFDNVRSHVWSIDQGSQSRDVEIPDGRYSAGDYAAKLQNIFTANTSNIIWYVNYNSISDKFDIRGDNFQGTEDVTISPNNRAAIFSGIVGEYTFEAGQHMSISSNLFKSNIYPAYYTIRSSSLRDSCMAYSGALSDIVAVVPITDGNVSVYQENTSMIPVPSGIVSYLRNQMNIRLCLEDGTEPITDPIFSMVFEFLL